MPAHIAHGPDTRSCSCTHEFDAGELMQHEHAAVEIDVEPCAYQQTKTEFLAKLSHEIRTHMTAILGVTSLLLETPLTDQQQRYIQTISVSAEAMMPVIDGILDYAKMDNTKEP